ncbi:hypothetical protein JCM3765_005604, partial [Sporobolomyces pararoseus]
TRMPTLLDLPDETLLAIFLQPRLSYNDLKRISRTCKKLHSIEQDESLDSKLFRKGLPPSPPPPTSRSKSKPKISEAVVLCKKGDNVKFHPIFNEVQSLVEVSLDGVVVVLDNPGIDDGQGGFKYGGSREVRVEELECFNEYATSPPCRSLKWLMGGCEGAQNPCGVTVQEAINAAVESWNAELDEDEAAGYLAFHDLPDLEPGETLCYFDTLSDHRFWEGMSSARCFEDDEVCFTPASFGS